MTPEKWQNIRGNIKDFFAVEDEGSLHLPDDGGIDIEYIVFKGPLGRMRLEFVSQPVVLDKKTTYSRRIGSETKVEYVYSADERSTVLHAYKWSDGDDDWVEIEAANFSG